MKQTGDVPLKTPFDKFGNYHGRSAPEPFKEVPTADVAEPDITATSTNFRAYFAVCSLLNVVYTPPEHTDFPLTCFKSEATVDTGSSEQHGVVAEGADVHKKTSATKPATKPQAIGRQVARTPIDYEKFHPFYRAVRALKGPNMSVGAHIGYWG